MNPITARIRLIATAAERSDALRSSSRSAGCTDLATVPRGRRVAETTPHPNITMPNSSDSFGESAASPPAGAAARAPVAPEIRPSLELASTSSVLLLTTVGISADRETP